MMDWSFLAERAKAMVIHPRHTWEKIRREETSVPEAFIEYVLPMAAIPAIAHLLGFWYHGFFDTIFKAVLWYVLAVAGVWIVGKIIYFLAANFDSVPNESKSFQLAAYSFSPFFMAGICYILPFLSIIVFFAGLYSTYLMSLGLPVLMEAPDDKVTFYTITVGAVMFFTILIVGHLTGGVLWPSKP